MANRLFTQFQYTLEKKIVHLYGKVAIGAAGAPTIDAAGSKGIASIVRNSAGKYTVTLQDAYVAFMGFCPTILLASGSPAVAQMVVRSVDTQSAQQIVIEFLDETLAAKDLASGAVLYFKIELKDTSV